MVNHKGNIFQFLFLMKCSWKNSLCSDCNENCFYSSIVSSFWRIFPYLREPRIKLKFPSDGRKIFKRPWKNKTPCVTSSENFQMKSKILFNYISLKIVSKQMRDEFLLLLLFRWSLQLNDFVKSKWIFCITTWRDVSILKDKTGKHWLKIWCNCFFVYETIISKMLQRL